MNDQHKHINNYNHNHDDDHLHEKEHEHDHGHDHHGHHHHAAPALENINRAFYIGIGLNAIFTVVEFVVGYFADSLALISDASHNLSDVASLILSLIGMKLAQKIATSSYTYGYKKASILASLINSILLVAIVINIFMEAVERLASPPNVLGKWIIITAIVGVFINAVSAFLFYKGQKHDINIKGAFLHLMVDAMVSIGVVISGIMIYYTGWHVIDPIVSFIIAIIILLSTWDLLKESLKLTLDGVPQNIDIEKIENSILENVNIENIHHVHIWALSSSENALTAHILLKEKTPVNLYMQIKDEIKHKLKDQNINHATIEIDDHTEKCEDENCT